MKNYITILFLFTFLGKTIAQFVENTPYTASCIDLSKSSTVGRMPNQDGISPNRWLPCGNGTTEDNPVWWVLRPSRDKLTFSFTTSSCKAGPCGDVGLSISLWETDKFGDLSVIDCAVGTSATLSDNVIPGKLYYLQFDGLCESQCNVFCSYDKKQFMTEVPAPAIEGPSTICSGASFSYTASLPSLPGCKPDDWNWSISPASIGTLNKVAGNNDKVNVKIINPLFTGNITICAEPSFIGKCQPKTNKICNDIFVSSASSLIDTCSVSICPADLPFLYYLNTCIKSENIIPATFEINFKPGTIKTEKIPFTIADSGCKGDLYLKINAKGQTPAFRKQLAPLLLCEDETSTIKGRTFSCTNASYTPIEFYPRDNKGVPNCDTIFEMLVQCIKFSPYISGKAALDCSTKTITLDAHGDKYTVVPKDINSSDYTGSGYFTGFQWRRNGSKLTNETNPTLKVSSAGNYQVDLNYQYMIKQRVNGIEITNTKACSKSASVTIDSLPGLSVAETPIAMSDPCANGESIYFINPDNNATSYKWSVSNGASISGPDNDPKKLIVKNTESSYQVCLVKKACGKSSEPSCITVNPVNKPVKPEITGAKTCEGDTTILNIANYRNYSPFAHFQWMVNNGTIFKWNPDSTQVKIKWAAQKNDRKIKLIVSENCGKDSVSLDINSTLPSTIQSNSPVCTGLSLELSAAGGTLYKWSGPNGFSGNNNLVTIPNASALSAGVYTVTVSDQSGCSAVLQTTAVVNQLVSTIKTNSPVCAGSILTMNVTGGNTYQWSGPNGFVGSMKDIEIKNCTDMQKGTYSVTVSNTAGCKAMLQTVVDILQLPAITISSNSPICSGKILQISASGGINFKWSGPANYASNAQNIQLSAVSLLQSGTYSVTVTNVGGCTSTSTTNFVVLDASATKPVIASNSPVCVGDSLKIQISGGASYMWSGPNGFNFIGAGIKISNVASTQSGIYFVTVTGSNGCEVNSQSDVKINPLPAVTASSSSPACVGTDVKLQAQGGNVYMWSGPDNFKSSLQNPEVTKVDIKNAGVYSVTVTDNNKCNNTGTTTVVVQNCISTKDNISKNKIKVFPNPAQDQLHITSAELIIKVQITNLLGQMVLDKMVNSNNFSLDVTNLIKGEYFTKVYLTENEFEVFKVSIQH